jgi:hypothetical protein
MEDLELIIGEEDGCSLHIEPFQYDRVYLTTYYFGDETSFRLTKKGAKQIVEHLTKVFEL